MEKRDRIILTKLIAYCDRIQNNLERFSTSFEAFESDPMFQDACCMCVVQIGELSALLSEEARSKAASVPWRLIKDTRNFYVHSYGDIDIPMVWDTLIHDIPVLRRACTELLAGCETQ